MHTTPVKKPAAAEFSPSPGKSSLCNTAHTPYRIYMGLPIESSAGSTGVCAFIP